MKTGRTLEELATEFERQAANKRDYLAPCSKLGFAVKSDGITLEGVNGGMPLRPLAHKQLGEILGIPKPYYDRMLHNAPDLLCRNANEWLARRGEKQLIRTLDGQVRAILSDSYRPLDNLDLAAAVLPKLSNLEATVISAEVTEQRFYLKAVTPRISGDVGKGDIIQAGLALSNSEVGLGSLRVEALDYRLVCLNGMIREQAVRKAHLGRSSRSYDAIEDAREYFTDRTRSLDDRAFFAKVQDAVAAMFNQERFNTRIEQYRVAESRQVTVAPMEVVEVLAKREKLTEQEKLNVMRHFLTGNKFTQWGLANAVTRAAEDSESYDRATELEALGGDVIELRPQDWRALAEAPAKELTATRA